MEEKEGGDRNRPHTIDKGRRRKGILPTLGQGSRGCPSRGITEHAKRFTIQPRDIQLARRICGDKDWDKLSYTPQL